ncbi:hypothetical protein P344_04310 [Spiroplasma mirum ATCC 29335]|uniref:Uncharacterized protein n=1 Tax=Spiroplasma mirum ATCC 29335 TaxID=838561 RepID=W6ALZ7_9MOLU|nr:MULTISPECIES: hypothetical protein [Spiroplasma]AHI58187.1 hypothetical protein P344_04310 [Spiroplasma mirum ATCC 29335]
MLIIGMGINFAIDKGLTWQSVGGMSLALITAFLYTIEAVGMYQLMRVSQN